MLLIRSISLLYLGSVLTVINCLIFLWQVCDSCNEAITKQCISVLCALTDGLVDCVDPDCCISASCRDSLHCRTAPEPMEILLRKQPPSSSASFYERMRFLIEDNSVQSYATLSSFNQRFYCSLIITHWQLHTLSMHFCAFSCQAFFTPAKI